LLISLCDYNGHGTHCSKKMVTAHTPWPQQVVILFMLQYPNSEYSEYDGSYGSSFRVVVNGIIVVKSARNYGPNPNTLVKCEPWVITVVVGTTDIDFFCDITLGDNITLKVSYIKANIKCYFASNRLTIGFWCVSVIMQHVINLVT
jgi:hypothetical protein